MSCVHRTGKTLLLAGLALAALGGACGSQITSSESFSDPGSLLDPSQPRSPDPTVHVTASGTSPQVLHLDHPVTVTFVNEDTVAHSMEGAPELRYSDCPEMSQLQPTDPGQTTTVTLERGGIICAYHDGRQPSVFAFQGILVVH
jgi:hypothetical protein